MIASIQQRILNLKEKMETDAMESCDEILIAEHFIRREPRVEIIGRREHFRQ